MLKKRNWLVLFACLTIGFPMHTLAADNATTEVGIGFADETSKLEESKQDDSKKAGTLQGDNQQKGNVASSQSGRKFLPNTGEKEMYMIQVLGFVCLAGVFLAALFFNVKKEGKHE
ncbi:LPXTG cell wall anchor domain-containing protein [Enterococcus sp. AZ196]|uniref:LPXTG cell wall anchor domain-containing protein n=1 Tax=Enterococcus sp. AZ196 TaxID=2774659 RepID=UPI003D285C7D